MNTVTKYIDLRSDTVTMPTDEMRQAMANAIVGDDVFSDDPTMNELEEETAKMLGKEDSVFVPSGTFSNQLALFTHCQRGDEVILDQNAHIVQHESGASAVIAGCQLFTMHGEGGMWDLNQFAQVIKERTISTTRTRLVCLENAFGGRVISLDYMEKVTQIARDRHLKIHLDGARIFNAAVALGCDVSLIAKDADSISVCLSKGLGAPIGTMLVGSAEFVKEARLKRKLMGGGMRQVGILAACGKIALEKMSKRLQTDHDNARYMEKLLAQIPNIRIDTGQQDINMVFFDIDDERKLGLGEFLFRHGVKTLGYEAGFRFVTHYDVSRQDIARAIALVREYFG